MPEDPSKFWLDRERALLAVVDVQEKLIPAMEPKVYGRVLATIRMLVAGAEILGLPVAATEQYPKGLGRTVPELAAACTEGVVEKMTFGCCGEPAFLERLKTLGRPQVIVTGMEAHVCVLQTVLGLLDAGYDVHLVRDGIIARGKIDYLSSLETAERAGAVLTTAETALFQLLRTAAAPDFKAISALVKGRGRQG